MDLDADSGSYCLWREKAQVKTELQRIEAFAFDVNDDYLQSYAGTFAILLQPGSMVKSV